MPPTNKAMVADALVSQTRNLLNAVRGSLIKVAQNLYEIKQTQGFAEKGAWASFLESELGISESFASKLLTVNRVYLIEGGLEPAQLEGVDYEKLYGAAKLPGSVEEKLASARTLTRAEIKQSKAENDAHTPVFGEFCSTCWLSKQTHP